ncbi:MAG: alpha/beta hydrolase [Sphingomonas sp.]
MPGKTVTNTLRSDHVPGEVPISIYLPHEHDRGSAESFPLLLLLHGGNGSEQDLLRFVPLIDRSIEHGILPPLVVVMPGARRSLYMDYRDGSERWETFLLEDLLPKIRRDLKVSNARERTFIGGWSMGGLGGLRLAFKHPEIFGAVAAIEPAIEPALAWGDIGPRVKFWRPDTFMETIFGAPVDQNYWAANNPATIVKSDSARLFNLGIYLEVGDQDMLYLHEGVEFLHRILFDAGIGHDYRLVHGAEHVGPSLEPRIADALAFIGRQIDPPNWVDERVTDQRSLMDEHKRMIGLAVEPLDARRIRGKP